MTNAYEWIKRIIKALFAPDDRHFASWIDKIAKKNQEILGPQTHGYLYMGVFYKPSDYPYRGKPKEVKVLHPSLSSQMDDWLKAKAAVEHEKALIRQTLSLVLEPCQTIQDIRDSLPECLIETIPELTRMERQREPAFTLSNNVRAMRQYEKILPKMEEYAAARFIS